MKTLIDITAVIVGFALMFAIGFNLDNGLALKISNILFVVGFWCVYFFMYKYFKERL